MSDTTTPQTYDAWDLLVRSASANEAVWAAWLEDKERLNAERLNAMSPIERAMEAIDGLHRASLHPDDLPRLEAILVRLIAEVTA